jgi:hypothetical protein
LIDAIIDEGKELFNAELAKIIKYRLKINLDKSNFNKYYFGIGILNRLKQLKNKAEYNIDAISGVFSIKDIIDDNLMMKKVKSRKRRSQNMLQIELHDVSEEYSKTQNLQDNEELLLLDRRVVKRKKKKQKADPESENKVMGYHI